MTPVPTISTWSGLGNCRKGCVCSPREEGLVVLDLELPDTQGLATFDKLFAVAPDLPILVFSRLKEASLANEAIQRGAYDNLVKDHLDRYTLTRALRHVIGHKKVEEVLLSENERAHVTLNAIGDAVVSTEISGKVTFLNPAAESMTGWSQPGSLGPAAFRSAADHQRHHARGGSQSPGIGDRAEQRRGPERELRFNPARRR